MERLGVIGEEIRADLSAQGAAQDEALRRSRELVRLCATAIRAIHREEWEAAGQLLAQARGVAAGMVDAVAAYRAFSTRATSRTA